MEYSYDSSWPGAVLQARRLHPQSWWQQPEEGRQQQAQPLEQSPELEPVLELQRPEGVLVSLPQAQQRGLGACVAGWA